MTLTPKLINDYNKRKVDKIFYAPLSDQTLLEFYNKFKAENDGVHSTPFKDELVRRRNLVLPDELHPVIVF